MARKVLFVAILVVGIIATFGEFLRFDPVDDIADDFWTPLQYFRRQAKQITKRYSIGNRVNCKSFTFYFAFKKIDLICKQWFQSCTVCE